MLSIRNDRIVVGALFQEFVGESVGNQVEIPRKFMKINFDI